MPTVALAAPPTLSHEIVAPCIIDEPCAGEFDLFIFVVVIFADNTNPLGINGMYWDEHRAEYMTPNRMFNPRTGRWTQPDPHWDIRTNSIFGDSPTMMNDRYVPSIHAIIQSGNLYMFVMHDPVNFIDSSGLFATPANIIGGLVGAGLGAIIGVAIANHFELTGWKRGVVIGGSSAMTAVVGWFAGPAVVNVASHAIAGAITTGNLALTTIPAWIVGALNLGQRFAQKTATNIAGSTTMIPHLTRHTPSGGWKNKAKFLTDSARDINNLIARGLNLANNFTINSHDSFFTVVDMGQEVGTKGQQFLKIVFTAAGEIITAYPVRGL